MMDTELATKMLARADADALPAEHNMRKFATSFDDAARGYFGDPQTCDVKKFMGCWARARSTWCDYTGDPLV